MVELQTFAMPNTHRAGLHALFLRCQVFLRIQVTTLACILYLLSHMLPFKMEQMTLSVI